jgi:hypothetical protein
MEPKQFLLKFNPIQPFLETNNLALEYFVRRDLLGEESGTVQTLWQLPEAEKILRKQQADGSWKRAGENKHPAINPNMVETWRWLRILVDMYGFTRAHLQIEKACEYLFTCQTQAGDLRGVLANQYATYYTGAILSTIVKCGYVDDPRVETCFQWILSMRQDDLGWSIPMITHKLDRQTQYRLSSEYAEPLELDRSKPFSHTATGMILRAFAAHPAYRHSEPARIAANLLKSRFFQADAYTSYHDPSYWVRFEYPYWWNNLMAALDSISKIGISVNDPQIQLALDWLVEHQQPDGMWKVTYAKDVGNTPKIQALKRWISMDICRIIKRIACITYCT